MDPRLCRLSGTGLAVLVGTALAWATGIAPNRAVTVPAPGFHPPVPVLGDLFAALRAGHGVTYLGVIVPTGLFNLVGSLQNIESAEASGDASRGRFPWKPAWPSSSGSAS